MLGGLQPVGLEMASFSIKSTPTEGAFSEAKGQSGESRRSVKPWSEINPQGSQAHDTGAQGESTSHQKIQFNHIESLQLNQKPVSVSVSDSDHFPLFVH